MTRNDPPLLHLAEPPARQRPQPGVHSMDTVFLFTTLIFVLGGGLFVIDLASARRSGQEATRASQFLAEASVWMPTVIAGAAKYGMLLLASILNSAFIVLLVAALRTLDRNVGRLANRRASRFAPMRKVHNMRRARSAAAARARESQGFLLSPVFR